MTRAIFYDLENKKYLFFETHDFIFRTANFMMFSVINISHVSLNMYFVQEHTQKNEKFI